MEGVVMGESHIWIGKSLREDMADSIEEIAEGDRSASGSQRYEGGGLGRFGRHREGEASGEGKVEAKFEARCLWRGKSKENVAAVKTRRRMRRDSVGHILWVPGGGEGRGVGGG
jgi:hypothetical protein